MQIEWSFVIVLAMIISPFHYTKFFFTHFINSFKAIVTGKCFFSSFAVKYIVLKPSSKQKIFRYEDSIVTLSEVIFHRTLIVRSILHDIETGSLSFSADKISNKESTIFFVHFADFNWSIDLNSY